MKKLLLVVVILFFTSCGTNYFSKNALGKNLDGKGVMISSLLKSKILKSLPEGSKIESINLNGWIRYNYEGQKKTVIFYTTSYGYLSMEIIE